MSKDSEVSPVDVRIHLVPADFRFRNRAFVTPGVVSVAAGRSLNFAKQQERAQFRADLYVIEDGVLFDAGNPVGSMERVPIPNEGKNLTVEQDLPVDEVYEYLIVVTVGDVKYLAVGASTPKIVIRPTT